MGPSSAIQKGDLCKQILAPLESLINSTDTSAWHSWGSHSEEHSSPQATTKYRIIKCLLTQFWVLLCNTDTFSANDTHIRQHKHSTAARLCCIDYVVSLNSSPPSATYMHQWIQSALVQIMAWRLFGTKPLSTPMLAYCHLDSWKQISVKFKAEFYHFHSRKCIWNCRLPKWRPFCPGGEELRGSSLIIIDMLYAICCYNEWCYKKTQCRADSRLAPSQWETLF